MDDRQDLHVEIAELIAGVEALLAASAQHKPHVVEARLPSCYSRLMLGEIGPAEYAEQLKDSATRAAPSGREQEATAIAFPKFACQRSVRQWGDAVDGRSPAAPPVPPMVDLLASRREHSTAAGLRTMAGLSWALLILPLMTTLGAALVALQSTMFLFGELTITVWQIWAFLLLGVMAAAYVRLRQRHVDPFEGSAEDEAHAHAT